MPIGRLGAGSTVSTVNGRWADMGAVIYRNIGRWQIRGLGGPRPRGGRAGLRGGFGFGRVSAALPCRAPWRSTSHLRVPLRWVYACTVDRARRVHARRCRTLTALDRSEDRRSALSIRALRSAHSHEESGHAAPQTAVEAVTEHAPPPPARRPHIHRDRHTVHIRDTRLCRHEPGYRVPRQSRRAQYRSGGPAGTRSKLGTKLTIQIRVQTHAQIRADAVHQGTLRTRVARAHKSGDAFRLWPV